MRKEGRGERKEERGGKQQKGKYKEEEKEKKAYFLNNAVNSVDSLRIIT